ncbi:hypothetical protein FPV67DRAFT_122629 [Lyophyllum atratum]|nr:hypothetical protein FPV67DRAFT_122629 [Lyophyllum atratum]
MMSDLASHFIGPSGDEASAFSIAEVRANACAYILSEISSSEAVTCLWKRRLNALALVSRLPPEILGTIFKHVASGATKRARLGWICVSHVCSYWRSAALDCPDLWSDIPFTHLSWAAEMVQRSKMAPLRVAVAFRRNSDTGKISQRKAQAVHSVLSQVLTQTSRIKELSISQSVHWSHTVFMELIELLDAPAPLLEKFDISFGAKDPGGRLPDGLLASPSRLIHLRLSRCGITWQGLVFSNLKTLRILNIPNAMHPTMNQFLTALSEMPSLEILVFCSSFAPPDIAHTASQTTATLPCLRSLQVDSDFGECAVLLDCLTYPKNIQVQVKCRVFNSDIQSASRPSLIRRLAAKLIDGIDGQIRSLAVKECRIKCWRSPNVVLDDPEISPTFSVQLGIFSTLAEEFLNLLPIDRLSALEVMDTNLSHATWLNLGRLSQLQTLRVGSQTETAVLDTLSHGISCFAGESAGVEQPVVMNDPMFSALSNLIITYWTFDGLSTIAGPSLMVKLAECLELRNDAGLRLHYLRVEDCPYIDEEDIDMDCFENLVDIFRFSRYDGYEDSESTE